MWLTFPIDIVHNFPGLQSCCENETVPAPGFFLFMIITSALALLAYMSLALAP